MVYEGSGEFYRDTNCSTTSPLVSAKWWSVPYETYLLFFLQSGPKVNSASWQMAAAHKDFDSTRGISSHCICTRHIHSFWTRPNLEAVLLVALVATVDNTAIWLALLLWLLLQQHLLQIEDLWRRYRITNKTTRKIKDKKLSLTVHWTKIRSVWLSNF